jgi:hypothetical protein
MTSSASPFLLFGRMVCAKIMCFDLKNNIDLNNNIMVLWTDNLISDTIR